MAGRLGKGRPGQLVVDTSTGISHGGIRKTPKSSTPKTPASRLAAGYRKQKLTTARHPRIHIRTRAPTHTHTHTHMQHGCLPHRLSVLAHALERSSPLHSRA